MVQTDTKMVKEIFKDFNFNSFELSDAIILNVNLYKKTAKIQLDLQTSKIIKLKELIDFEKYIEDRFFIKQVVITIKYDEEIDVNFQDEWKDLYEYISYKYPLIHALLKNSNLIAQDNKIRIDLVCKGKDVLEARGFDRLIEETIKNIYGKKYKVEFKEDVPENFIEQFQEQAKELEKQAIKLMEQEVKETVKEEKKEIKEVVKEEKSEEVKEEKSPLIYGRSLKIKEQLSKISELSVDSGKVLLDGEILNTDTRELKSGKFLLTFDLYDGSSTITCKAFLEADKKDAIMSKLKGVKGVKVEGTAQFDPFSKELGVISNTIIESTGIKREVRKDEAKIKRVELHLHTQMSQMDGMTAAKDLLKRAVKWGMKSIAITDHGVVQAFPEAHKYLEKDHPDLKVIYGVEAYLAPDNTSAVSFSKNQPLDDTTFCVLDLETTGFSFRTEKITEIGIMKVKNGEVIDEFSCFVNPEKPIPPRVVEVTNITDEMVKDAETIDKVMPKLLEFVGDSVLVAHNADFDIGFLKHNCAELGYKLDNTYIDTLRLAKQLFPTYKKYKLGIIAENLGIKVEVAHRALDDVDTTVKVLNVMFKMLKDKNVVTLDDS